MKAEKTPRSQLASGQPRAVAAAVRGRLPDRRNQRPRGINHQQDWIRACKGGISGVSEFSTASKYVEWLALGAVAWRVPGKLTWDAKNMRFGNNTEANKHLRPYLRKGWEMKL